MKFSLLTIAALSTTISCFKVWADTAAAPRKRKVAKKDEGSANSSGSCDPNCGGDKTEGQKCFGGQTQKGLCIDGLYCYISGTTTVSDTSGGAFCCPEGKKPSNVNTCGDRPPPGPGPGPAPSPAPAPSPGPGPGNCDPNCGGDKTEGQPCFGGQTQKGLCIDGLYCYISGTTTVSDTSGGAFCCPEGFAPTNRNTCGDRPPPPLPPSTAPGPFGWQKSAGGDGMTYHGVAYDVLPACDRICAGSQTDMCDFPGWQGAASPACTEFCEKVRNGGSYTITGHDGEAVEVTNLAVGHCIGDSSNRNECRDSCGKTYAVYNKDTGSGGAASYAIIMGIDGAPIPSFEMSTDKYDIFRGTTPFGSRVIPTYYNLAEGPMPMP